MPAAQILARRYEVLGPLGRGGMGDVLLVRDLELSREVALKRLHLRDAEAVARFRDEFALLARIEHPNIVRVFDFGVLPGQGGGDAYYTMEYLEGNSIDEAIAPGDVPSLLRAITGISAGLDALHHAGILHCDLKPANIQMVPSSHPDSAKGASTPLLVDFGLAGWNTGLPTTRTGSPSPASSKDSTQVRGTPGFVAPEVLAGKPYSRASDLYALGATLYRVLSGRSAFPGRSAAEVLAAQRAGRPSAFPLRATGVPGALEQAVLAMIEPAAEARLSAWSEVVELAHRHQGDRGVSIGSRGAFVGREQELRRLRGHLLGGAVQLSVVRGASGSGKSRLGREVAVEAELAGWAVEWFDQDRLPGMPEAPSPSDAPGAARTLLVLDDIDRWPTDALRNLELAWRTPPFSILCFVDSADASEEWIGALLSLPEDPFRRDVALEGLGPEAIARLVRGRLGEDAPPDLIELVTRHAGNLPGSLHATIDALATRGILRDATGAWVRDFADVAQTLEAGIEADPELESWILDPTNRREVLGLACSNEVVTLGEDAARFLLWRNLVTPEGSGWVPRSRNIADRLRATALSSLSREDREFLGPFLSDDSVPAGEMAARTHRVRGEIALALGQDDRARSLLLEAVRSAPDPNDGDATAALSMIVGRLLKGDSGPDPLLLALSRHFAALGQDRRVADLLALVLRGQDIPPTVRIAAAYDRARALHRLGEYQGALDTLDAAAEDLEEAEVPASEWHGQRASTLQFLGRFAESRVEFERALERIEPTDHAARAAMRSRFAMMTYLNLDPVAGKTLLEKARDEASRSAPGLLKTLIGLNFALVANHEGDLEAALAGYKSGVEFFERERDHARLGQGLANYANAASVAGRWELLESLTARASRIARQRHNVQLLLNVLATRANAAVRRGSIAEARSIQRSERAWLPSVQRLEAKLHYLVHRAETLRLQGRRRRARSILRRILNLPIHRAIPKYTGLALVVEGTIEARRGRVLEAEASLLKALESRAQDVHVFETANIEMARLAAWSTTTPSALQAIDRLLEAQTASCAGPGLKAEAEGWKEFLSGSKDAAVALFDRALDSYRSAGLMTHHVELGRIAGLALASPSHGRHSARWLSQSLVTARSLRLSDLARRIADELFELTGGPGATGSHHDRSAPERETLYRVSEILNSALDPSSLLPRALAIVCERIGAERGFILLTGTTGEPRPVAQYGLVDDESRASALEVSGTVIRRVTTSGEAFHSDDATSDPRLGSTLSILDMSVRSLLCVPLRLGNEVIGTIYAENRSSAGQFDMDQVELLEAFANLVAVAIQNARLHEELRRAQDRVVGENLSLRRVVGGKYGPGNLIGQSAVIERIQGEIERIAQSKATVLITGESGSGKDLVAKTIHFSSPRAGRPFLSLNCAALPADLIESELFGIEARVATGVDRRLGIFERADGGTLFLDEIGDMPLDLQAKLLRVLQDREFTRIGGSDLIKVDVRLIAATNQDLQDLIEERKFREDLFFRLHMLPIHLPPLRERMVDVPLLADHFLSKFCEDNSLPVPRMSAAFTATLLRSQWPGNVRELQNYIERSVVMSPGNVLEPVVQPSDLDLRRGRPAAPNRAIRVDDQPPADLKTASRETERTMIQRALALAGGNQRRAAAVLGVPEPTLRYRMRRLGISRWTPPAPQSPVA